MQIMLRLTQYFPDENEDEINRDGKSGLKVVHWGTQSYTKNRDSRSYRRLVGTFFYKVLRYFRERKDGDKKSEGQSDETVDEEKLEKERTSKEERFDEPPTKRRSTEDGRQVEKEPRWTEETLEELPTEDDQTPPATRACQRRKESYEFEESDPVFTTPRASIRKLRPFTKRPSPANPPPKTPSTIFGDYPYPLPLATPPTPSKLESSPYFALPTFAPKCNKRPSSIQELYQRDLSKPFRVTEQFPLIKNLKLDTDRFDRAVSSIPKRDVQWLSQELRELPFKKSNKGSGKSPKAPKPTKPPKKQKPVEVKKDSGKEKPSTKEKPKKETPKAKQEKDSKKEKPVQEKKDSGKEKPPTKEKPKKETPKAKQEKDSKKEKPVQEKKESGKEKTPIKEKPEKETPKAKQEKDSTKIKPTKEPAEEKSINDSPKRKSEESPKGAAKKEIARQKTKKESQKSKKDSAKEKPMKETPEVTDEDELPQETPTGKSENETATLSKSVPTSKKPKSIFDFQPPPTPPKKRDKRPTTPKSAETESTETESPDPTNPSTPNQEGNNKPSSKQSTPKILISSTTLSPTAKKSKLSIKKLEDDDDVKPELATKQRTAKGKSFKLTDIFQSCDLKKLFEKLKAHKLTIAITCSLLSANMMVIFLTIYMINTRCI